MSSFFTQTKEKTADTLEAGADKLRDTIKPMAVPVYSDIAKAANDVR